MRRFFQYATACVSHFSEQPSMFSDRSKPSCKIVTQQHEVRQVPVAEALYQNRYNVIYFGLGQWQIMYSL